MYTQEQLEAMSNKELNRKVELVVSPLSDGTLTTDYCNSWADIGPIAMDNNIVITPCMGINKGDATRYFEHVNPVCSEFSDNKEALRAAAIVYLMMEGGQ